jgi:hypothetical protein
MHMCTYQQPLGFLRPATTSRRAVASPRERQQHGRSRVAMAAGEKEQLEGLRFLTPEAAERAAAEFGTPIYVYDMATLAEQARKALAFPNAFGLTVRYAMKSSPNAAILKVGVCVWCVCVCVCVCIGRVHPQACVGPDFEV